ncbi:MAG TPA: restriction endonuclease subunit S [Glutamicibacter sp.]|nr:restriction endonuclease subunit S [Glutamicibacter sp.]
MVSVRALSELITKGTTPTSIGRNFTANGVRFLKVETFEEDGTYVVGKEAFIDEETHRQLSRSQLADGDVLFSIAGALGRSTVVEPDWLPANTNQALAIIRPSRKRGLVRPLYLLWALRSPTVGKRINEINVQAAQANLSLQQVGEFEIPIPNLAEQEAIAAALDDVDALVKSLKRIVAKKLDVKQGMMQELLTGRTRLPGFTGDWRNVTLGDHVAYVRSVALSREQLDQGSPLRYLHYGDIHTRKSVRLDATSEFMPRAASHLASGAGRLIPGDLVFADASEDPDGVGKSVEISDVPPEGVVPGLHTIAARFDKSVLADGFKAYIQFIPAFRAALLRLAAGTKVLATTRSYISSLKLPLPGADEQHAIAQVLEDADAEIEALERRLESARAVKVGMMQELLTGRTRLPTKEEV